MSNVRRLKKFRYPAVAVSTSIQFNYRDQRVNSKNLKLAITAVALTLLSGCSTQGRFVIPQGSTLYLADRPEPVQVAADGMVTTRAFGWESMGVPPAKGIKYRLEKDGQTTQEGRLRPTLRIIAIFLPPVIGILTVPTGLRPDITYDLVTGKQE